MTFDNCTYEITMAQGDYGIPMDFSAGKEEGFQNGDKIIFIFDTDKLNPEDFTFEVDKTDFHFQLKFTKEQSDSMFDRDIETSKKIPYSIERRNSANEYLETLKNELGETIYYLKVFGAVRSNGENQS